MNKKKDLSMKNKKNLSESMNNEPQVQDYACLDEIEPIYISNQLYDMMRKFYENNSNEYLDEEDDTEKQEKDLPK